MLAKCRGSDESCAVDHDQARGSLELVAAHRHGCVDSRLVFVDAHREGDAVLVQERFKRYWSHRAVLLEKVLLSGAFSRVLGATLLVWRQACWPA